MMSLLLEPLLYMCTIQFVGTQNRFTMLRCLMSGCCGLAEKKLKYTSKKCTLTQIHNSTTLSLSMTLGILCNIMNEEGKMITS